MARLSRSRSRADRRSVLVVVLDDDVVMPVMTGRDGADNDSVGTVVAVPMALAMVIEGDLSVMPMMKTLAIFIDEHVVFVVTMMMMSVGRDDHVGFGGRSHRGRGQAQRQSAQDHDFHCNSSSA